MLKKIITAMLLIVVVFYAFGCFTHSHVVGKGPKSSQVMEEKQWYVLWGLVPLNKIDTNTMAGKADDYTIETSTQFLDFVIGAFTGIVSVYPRTVKVIK